MPRPKLRPLGCGNAYASLLARSRCMHRLSPLGPAVGARARPIPLVHTRTLKLPAWMGGRPEKKTPDKYPGVDVLEELVGRLDRQTGRLHTNDELWDAFAQLTEHLRPGQYSAECAYLLRRCYQYLREKGFFREIREVPGWSLRHSDGPEVLEQLLKKMYLTEGAQAVALTRTVLRDIVKDPVYKPKVAHLRWLAAAYAKSGAPRTALNRVRKLSGCPEKIPASVWEEVLEGFVRCGNVQGMEETKAYLQSLGVRASILHHYMIKLYLRLNQFDKAREYYEKTLIAEVSPNHAIGPILKTCVMILKACREAGKLDWGNRLIMRECQTVSGRASSNPQLLEESLKWAALSGNFDRVESLVKYQHEVLQSAVRKESFDDPEPALASAVLKETIKYILQMGNLEMAEHLMALRKKLDPEANPDRESYEIELLYRLRAGDVAGAYAMFEDLRFLEDIPPNYSGSEAQMLLRALCSEAQPDMSQILGIFKDLREWKVEFETETVLSMLKLFLRMNSWLDVSKVLNMHVGVWGSQDRDKAIQTIADYITHPQVSHDTARQAYSILNRTFPEANVDVRQGIMTAFFQKGQPLRAIRVFGSMRHLNVQNHHYAAAFYGAGDSGSIEALENLHRMLNMAMNIDVDTKLQNAIMYAYAKCELTSKALNVYEDILLSTEGPDMKTVEVVLNDVYGDMIGGLQPAKEAWRRYIRSGVKLEESTYCAYVKCLCVHGDFGEAVTTVLHNKYRETGEHPGPELVAKLWRCLPPKRRMDLEERMQQHREHKAVWDRIGEDVKRKEKERIENMTSEEMAILELVKEYHDEEARKLAYAREPWGWRKLFGRW